MSQDQQQTDSSASKSTSTLNRNAAYVRMPEAEYQSLAKDALLLGKTLPETLREGYFQGGGGVSVLMPKHDQSALMVALARIGNNVNQIARRMNGGIMRVAEGEFLSLQDEFANLNALIRTFSSRGMTKRWR